MHESLVMAQAVVHLVERGFESLEWLGRADGCANRVIDQDKEEKEELHLLTLALVLQLLPRRLLRLRLA